MFVFDEFSHGIGVLVDVTTGETLVGHVHVDEQLALLHEGREFVPLLRSRIDTRGIVSARMKQNDGVLRDLFDVFLGTVEIEAARFRVVVAVGFHVESSMFHDGRVIAPRWIGQVDHLVAWEELRLEQRTYAAVQGEMRHLPGK